MIIKPDDMRRYILILSIAGFAVLNSSCKKDEEIQLDKQITLSFGGPSYGSIVVSSDTIWRYLTSPDFKLINFNKHNYSGLKSAVFAAGISSIDPKNFCVVELFNYTDSVPIPGSEIRNNSYADTFTCSGNILASLPDGTYDLGVRMKSTKKIGASLYNSMLYTNIYLFLNR
jgi:hypothetical protein